MAIENINVGAAPNDKTGDKLRAAFVKVNSNFSDLDTRTTAAQTTADGAQGAASAAQTAADDALTAANAAQAAASAAQSTANDAVSDAAAASAAAAAASSAAATADGKAVAAQGTANDALSAANQALSTAYLRRGALPADTTHDLNNWGIAEVGVWFQSSSASATLAQNYPVATAGILEILPRTPDFGGRVVQRYTRYLDGRTYTRSQNNAGTWSAWERFDTVSERDSALANYVTNSALTSALANYALKANLEWLSKPIGEPFPLWDHMPGLSIPPTDNPQFRFIKLTAGDAYNSGVLTGESVSGTAPLVNATATISLSESPINGATVRLINTETRALRAGVSGTVQNDALQNITGSIQTRYGIVVSSDGAFQTDDSSTTSSTTFPSSQPTRMNTFDASRVARTDNETRMKNIQATYYMRIL